jgi:hypothetical protein
MGTLSTFWVVQPKAMIKRILAASTTVHSVFGDIFIGFTSTELSNG